MATPSTLLLAASPARSQALVAWLESRVDDLRGISLLVPDDLAGPIRDRPALSGNPLTTCRPLAEGGDIALAARVLAGEAGSVICFWGGDPSQAGDGSPPGQVSAAPLPPEALLRAALLADVPLALNEASADLMLRGLARSRIGYLIFNPVAGQGDPDQELAQIRACLEPQLLLQVVLTQPDRDPADQARELVDQITARRAAGAGEAIVIASGGDGTVGAVAGALIETGIPLGIIPRGTANAFSVALGIPTPLRAACRTLLVGHTRAVDAALCNDTPMILLAGLGFEAGMVEKASREMKDALGPLAYILAGAQHFAQQESFRAEIEIEGGTRELDAAAITVASTAPPTSVMAQGFGTVIPDDGLLDVIVASPENRLQGLQMLSSLVTSAIGRTPATHDNLLSLRTREVTIRTDPPQHLVVDGEIIEANPIRFRCLPGALTVVAPLQTGMPDGSAGATGNGADDADDADDATDGGDATDP